MDVLPLSNKVMVLIDSEGETSTSSITFDREETPALGRARGPAPQVRGTLRPP